MTPLFLSLSYILLPVGIIYLCEKNRHAAKIGAVIIAYGIGLLLGNSGLVQPPSDFLHDLIGRVKPEKIETAGLLAEGLLTHTDVIWLKIRRIQDILLTITILLAIPLLLFSLKMKEWLRMAGKAILSLLLALVSVLVVVFAGFVIFGNRIPEAWKISGMLIGLYTGGTPNLAALKLMLDVDAATYILTHTYDTLVSAVYLFFLMTAGKRLFRAVLPPYPATNVQDYKIIRPGGGSYSGFFRPSVFVPLMAAMLVAALIFCVGGALSLLVSDAKVMVTVILTITTLGILVSLIKKINQVEKTYELGMYFILVFSIVVASMADIHQLAHIEKSLFYYITFAVFVSLLMHVFLSKIFKIDADTVMVTSTAMICSPPFVPVVAGALGNREIVISGLTIGIIGYAIGNYLGVFVAYFLQGY